MSNKMHRKRRAMEKKLAEDPSLRIPLENFQAALDQSLQSVSPGSRITINPDKIGSFFIFTPNERMDLESVVLLGSILQFSPLVGEQALIYAVKRTNALTPLLYSLTDPVPESDLIPVDNFMDKMISGKARDLASMVGKLNALNDSEGAAFGMMMSMAISESLQPFNASLVAPDEMQLFLKIGPSKHPVLSPTIFLFVLRNVVLKSTDDLAKALVISNIIHNPYAYTSAGLAPSNN